MSIGLHTTMNISDDRELKNQKQESLPGLYRKQCDATNNDNDIVTGQGNSPTIRYRPIQVALCVEAYHEIQNDCELLTR